MRKQQEMEARCFFRVLNRCNACKAHNYTISNFVVVFDHEDLGQVLAGFPSTIVIYNDPCIVVLNQVCQIHSESQRITAKYINPNIFVSATHTSRCACLSSLSLIIRFLSIYFIAQSPRLFGSHDFWPFLQRFWRSVRWRSANAVVTSCKRYPDIRLWQKELHLMSQLHVSCHPIKYIQNRMRALRILKDIRKVSCWLNCETWWNQLYQNASMFADVLTWRFWSLWCHLWPEALRVTQGWDGWEVHFQFLSKDQFDSCSGRSIFVPI